MVRSRMIFALILLLLLAAGLGCATVKPAPDYTDIQVKKMIDAARFSGAETKSPYELFSAELHFQQALRDKAQGNWATARKNMHRAHESARQAYENARKFRKAQ